MRLGNKKTLKALFTSGLVVALASVEAEIKHMVHDQHVLAFFILFCLSLIIIVIIEFAFEQIDELDWFQKKFCKHDYINGWWLNYAIDKETNEIFNFAIIQMEKNDDEISVEGSTFKACKSNEPHSAPKVSHDGRFTSTIAHFSAEKRLLSFNFLIPAQAQFNGIRDVSGTAEYQFQESGGIPKDFVGEFSINGNQKHCNVIGHRINDENFFLQEGQLERYRSTLEYALNKHWIELSQLTTSDTRCSVGQKTIANKQLEGQLLQGCVAHGLSEIGRFNLITLLGQLKRGDELYWLDTYCPKTYKINRALRDALAGGANIKILTIKQDCPNAVFRAKEHDKYDVKRYPRAFMNGVHDYHAMLFDIFNEQSQSLLEVREYESLLGTPMYIHLRAGKPIKGWSGFYLHRSASEYLFIEWVPSTESFLDGMVDYFTKKWEDNADKQIIPPLYPP